MGVNSNTNRYLCKNNNFTLKQISLPGPMSSTCTQSAYSGEPPPVRPAVKRHSNGFNGGPFEMSTRAALLFSLKIRHCSINNLPNVLN